MKKNLEEHTLDLTTNKVTITPYTDEQTKAHNESEIQAEMRAEQNAVIIAARAVAQEKLAALGLTTDDLKALGL